MAKEELSPKIRRFIAEYLKDQNGKQAAIRAGYSAKTAQEQSSRLLSNVKVRAEVDRLLEQITSKGILTRQQILLEASRVAGFDPIGLVDENGRRRKLQELPEDLRRCIIGVKVSKDGSWEYTFASKTKGIELMGRHRKLWVDRLEVTDKTGLADKLKKARERAKGAGG